MVSFDKKAICSPDGSTVRALTGKPSGWKYQLVSSFKALFRLIWFCVFDIVPSFSGGNTWEGDVVVCGPSVWSNEAWLCDEGSDGAVILFLSEPGSICSGSIWPIDWSSALMYCKFLRLEGSGFTTIVSSSIVMNAAIHSSAPCFVRYIHSTTLRLISVFWSLTCECSCKSIDWKLKKLSSGSINGARWCNKWL